MKVGYKNEPLPRFHIKYYEGSLGDIVVEVREMEIFDNINKTVKDDLSFTIKKGSRLSIAAACFSIYAYQVLKQQFDAIDELRFIFTSPALVTEKAPKEKREFYIPRFNRDRRSN